MLVSRKNLPLIHLVSRIRTLRPDVTQPPHERVNRCSASRLRRVFLEPLAKGSIQRGVARLRYQPGLLNQRFFCAQRDVFHTGIVYTIFVCFASGVHFLGDLRN